MGTREPGGQPQRKLERIVGGAWSIGDRCVVLSIDAPGVNKARQGQTKGGRARQGQGEARPR